MDDRTWERYGALGGVWFFVLTLISGIIVGAPPSRTDSAAEIAKYYADNDSAIQVGAFLAAIAVIGLVWWFGTLWRAMAKAEGGTPRVAVIVLVGLVLSGIGAMVGFTIDAGTAAAIGVAGEGSAMLFQISNVSFGFSAMGDFVMTIAVAGLILRTGFLPRWVAYLSALAALLSIVATISIASDAAFFSIIGLVAAIVWGLWILVIAILNYQKASAKA